jgi:hypothetical protein
MLLHGVKGGKKNKIKIRTRIVAKVQVERAHHRVVERRNTKISTLH